MGVDTGFLSAPQVSRIHWIYLFESAGESSSTSAGPQYGAQGLIIIEGCSGSCPEGSICSAGKCVCTDFTGSSGFDQNRFSTRFSRSSSGKRQWHASATHWCASHPPDAEGEGPELSRMGLSWD
jgi:hypothetical protein